MGKKICNFIQGLPGFSSYFQHGFVLLMGCQKWLRLCAQTNSEGIDGVTQRLNRKGLSDKRSAVGFCLGSGLFGSYNSD